jgi:putative toxin-antitoxin system antitoxin component (TIGR02293 family)
MADMARKGDSPKGKQKRRSSKIGVAKIGVAIGGVADAGENVVSFEDYFAPVYHLSSFEKITMVREGIPKRDLEHLKSKTGLDYDQLAAILSVARATLINKKGNDRFNLTLSEKILGLAEIYSYGYEVFGDQARFNEWIFRPNRSLGGQTPYDLLDSQYGRDEVKNVIGRIDFGIYS